MIPFDFHDIPRGLFWWHRADRFVEDKLAPSEQLILPDLNQGDWPLGFNPTISSENYVDDNSSPTYQFTADLSITTGKKVLKLRSGAMLRGYGRLWQTANGDDSDFDEKTEASSFDYRPNAKDSNHYQWNYYGKTIDLFRYLPTALGVCQDWQSRIKVSLEETVSNDSFDYLNPVEVEPFTPILKGQLEMQQTAPYLPGNYFVALIKFELPSWSDDDARYQSDEYSDRIDVWRFQIGTLIGPVVFGLSPTSDNAPQCIGTLFVSEWTANATTCKLSYTPSLVASFHRGYDAEEEYIPPVEFEFDRVGQWCLWESEIKRDGWSLKLNGQVVAEGVLPAIWFDDLEWLEDYGAGTIDVETSHCYDFSLFGLSSPYQWDDGLIPFAFGFGDCSFAEAAMFRAEFVTGWKDVIVAKILRNWGLENILESHNPYLAFDRRLPVLSQSNVKAFPSIIPTSRAYTAGGSAITPYVSESGTSVRVRHSNLTTIGCSLDLEFIGISDEQEAAIRSHYASVNGQYETFGLPWPCVWNLETIAPSLLNYSARGVYSPKGHSWCYQSSPSISTDNRGIKSASVGFRLLPERIALRFDGNVEITVSFPIGDDNLTYRRLFIGDPSVEFRNTSGRLTWGRWVIDAAPATVGTISLASLGDLDRGFEIDATGSDAAGLVLTINGGLVNNRSLAGANQLTIGAPEDPIDRGILLQAGANQLTIGSLAEPIDRGLQLDDVAIASVTVHGGLLFSPVIGITATVEYTNDGDLDRGFLIEGQAVITATNIASLVYP